MTAIHRATATDKLLCACDKFNIDKYFKHTENHIQLQLRQLFYIP